MVLFLIYDIIMRLPSLSGFYQIHLLSFFSLCFPGILAINHIYILYALFLKVSYFLDLKKHRIL